MMKPSLKRTPIVTAHLTTTNQIIISFIFLVSRQLTAIYAVYVHNSNGVERSAGSALNFLFLSCHSLRHIFLPVLLLIIVICTLSCSCANATWIYYYLITLKRSCQSRSKMFMYDDWVVFKVDFLMCWQVHAEYKFQTQ